MIAVFPTPGSPIKTGLFLERLDRICTVRRISSSRPITGSSFPWHDKKRKCQSLGHVSEGLA